MRCMFFAFSKNKSRNPRVSRASRVEFLDQGGGVGGAGVGGEGGTAAASDQKRLLGRHFGPSELRSPDFA